jgi:glycosyltransferase involved in cell wall biosynthesis
VRILYFADIRFPLERANGIQTMETCWALAERGHTVHLVVRPDTHAPARDPFEYYGLPAHARLIVERAPVTGAAVPAMARRIGYLAFAAGRVSGSGRADIVMTRDLTVASLLLHLPGHAPVVYESHGYAPDVAAALPRMVSTAHAPSRAKLARLAKREAQVWKQADGYVTITAGLAEELVGRFGARPRLAVVPDGARIVDRSGIHETQMRAPRPEPRAPEPPAPITVAYAGHLYAWKGVDVLLDGLARLAGVRGLIVGGHEQEPDLARLREQAARLGIGDRVSFTGQVPPSDVPAMLSRADVLALPNPPSAISTHATSPLKLFEYMAARRAIVASDLPSIREVLADDVTALLVVPGDADSLADGIRRLARDSSLRERLAGAAFGAVAEYSWSRRAERLETLFSEVLAASRR